VAYRVTQEQLKELDRHEGAPRNYIRTVLPIITRTGDGIMGYTYIAHPDKLVFGKKPEDSYRQHLLQGYSDHGLGELSEYEC